MKRLLVGRLRNHICTDCSTCAVHKTDIKHRSETA